MIWFFLYISISEAEAEKLTSRQNLYIYTFMKTLRIINQNLAQSEIKRNICLEGNDYDVIYKAKNNVIQEGKTVFEITMKNHFENDFVDDTIVAFVCGKNKTHPVRDYEVAYVINDEGRTIERIYGQYVKY